MEEKKERQKMEDKTEAFSTEVQPLLEQLYAKCEEHGFHMLVSVCYGETEDGWLVSEGSFVGTMDIREHVDLIGLGAVMLNSDPETRNIMYHAAKRAFNVARAADRVIDDLVKQMATKLN